MLNCNLYASCLHLHMPCQTEWSDHGVVWKWSGELSDAGILDNNREFYEHDRFSELRYQLCDFLEVNKISASNEGIRRAARQDAEASRRNPHVKVAIVTTSDLVYGLTRMYELSGYESLWQTEIFGTRAEAEAWVKECVAARSTEITDVV